MNIDLEHKNDWNIHPFAESQIDLESLNSGWVDLNTLDNHYRNLRFENLAVVVVEDEDWV